MKKIYSFLFLILFINASLASDDEGYYDDMGEELFREGRTLLDSTYYNPAAKDLFSQASQSRVLSAIERPTEEDSDDREVPKVVVSMTTSSHTNKTPDQPLEEKTLFDLLNDKDSEKALNFFKTGIPYETHTVHMSTLIHLSQFIKNNDMETILALTFFLDNVFNLSAPQSFDVEVFKSKLIKCKTPHSQREFIEAEKKRYCPLK